MLAPEMSGDSRTGEVPWPDTPGVPIGVEAVERLDGGEACGMLIIHDIIVL